MKESPNIHVNVSLVALYSRMSEPTPKTMEVSTAECETVVEEKLVDTDTPEEESKAKNLNEYADEMAVYIKELKTKVSELSPLELGMLIEQNKVSMSMFRQVYAILITEQVKRLNPTLNDEELGTTDPIPSKLPISLKNDDFTDLKD